MATKILLLVFGLLLMPDLMAAEKADFVLVEKAAHKLSLLHDGKLMVSFHVMFGANPVGHKQQQGDERTPEGRYRLDFKKRDSAFHRAIHINYPNAKDIADARKRGVSPGGDIMIHGQPNGYGHLSAATQKINWTNGCIALTDKDMDVVWQSVDAGTAIEIKP